jgi:signal transduction histidine kinase
LRCTELTLTAFADNSSVVMAIKSLDGVHHWVNNTFCHVFGNVEGCPVVDWMPPYAIEVTTEHDLEVWESQIPMRFLESIPTPDGIRRVWDVRKFPLMFDPGFETADRRFIGIVAIEVTAQIESTQQISEYARRLEKANASLNQFAYIVSHDLRAPLRSIEGFLVRFRNAVASHADLTEQETLYLDTVLAQPIGCSD